jgi:SAM-dependent methyltransferase
LFAASELFSFNLVRRDRWIAQQAGLLPAGTKVLDAGAGSAPYRALFSHCEYRSQDLARLEDEQLRHGGYARIDYVCDAASIPVPDGSFGAVLCTEMLEHHPRPIDVVHEFARILEPGGKLILTAPLGSGIHQEPYHFYGGYTPYWYERFLGEAGFETIRIEANEGTLRHYAQESIRFLQMTRPLRLGMPLPAELVWWPLWLLLLPLLGGAIPVICKLLDRFDRERRFTVGYHVTAVRSVPRSPAA